ncbi:hypothetical protein SNEBB_000233 [Seison nebaliae]|nr:hypothetical protein SNEBB_000233 [Seison nebaliae]
MAGAKIKVRLSRSDERTPWGIRLQGGREYGKPLTIVKIAPDSLAAQAGLHVDDLLIGIGELDNVSTMKHVEAQNSIRQCANYLPLTVIRNKNSFALPTDVNQDHNASMKPFKPEAAQYSDPQSINPTYAKPPNYQQQQQQQQQPSQQYSHYNQNPKYGKPPSQYGDEQVSSYCPQQAKPNPFAHPPIPNQIFPPSKRSALGKNITFPSSGTGMPTCAFCETNIRGPFVTASDKNWCPEHFICSYEGCGRNLQECGFVEEEGKLYCERDFEMFFAPKCYKCHQPIKYECVTALNQKWHPDCFGCYQCHKPIGQTQFRVEDGNNYCLPCHSQAFSILCQGCEFSIEPGDKFVEALNEKFHVTCFCCTVCGIELAGVGFVPRNGKPFCKKHGKAI